MSIQNNINKILICLKNTYSSPDKKDRENSEKTLAQLKNQNMVEFSTQLITILKSNLAQIDNNLKISLILYLK